MTKGLVIWLTGLSGSGKTTIAKATKNFLSSYHEMNNVILLDGDEIRKGLNKNLSFSIKDRTENIRRIAEITKLMFEQGYIVIVATISPKKNHRELAKKIIGKNNFLEVLIDTPFEICQSRDPKGLYKKAKNGKIKNFTGFSSIYEYPINPDIIITTDCSIISCAEQLSENILIVVEEW